MKILHVGSIREKKRRFAVVLPLLLTAGLLIGLVPILKVSATVESLPPPHVAGDFNGDGKDDVAAYDPSTGRWNVLVSNGTSFTNSIWTTFTTKTGWGPTLTGDFNGDGKTDLANYHAATGNWWVSQSTGTKFTNKIWTTFTTKTGWGPTLTGDFNGDGKTDIANYHAATGNWWVSQSTGTKFTNKIWTTFTTKTGWGPTLTGDYDGNGKDDIAGYRPGTGDWVVAKSTGIGFTNAIWTTFTTKTGWGPTLTGDFNGNGKTDLANHHAATGNWWVSKSTGTIFTNSKWATSAPPPSTTTTTLPPLLDTTIDVPAEMTTIQAAIDAASNGWTVRVAPGTYIENIDFNGKAITVKSSAGAEVTTIDGGGLGPTVSFWSGEGRNSVLDGFKVTGGANFLMMPGLDGTDSSRNGIGGGISVRNGSNVTIRNAIVTGNSARHGIGIGFENASAIIEKSRFERDSVYVFGSGPTSVQFVGSSINDAGDNPSASSSQAAVSVVNAAIDFNKSMITNSDTTGVAVASDATLTMADSAILDGAGIGIVTQGKVSLTHVTVAGNLGGGIFVTMGSTTIVDSIVATDNTASSAVDCHHLPVELAFTRTLISDGPGLALTGDQCLSHTWDPQLIIGDPGFLSPAIGDYRLAPGSLAIDAGGNDLTSDIDSHPRADGDGDGSVVSDLGAYEAPAANEWIPLATARPNLFTSATTITVPGWTRAVLTENFNGDEWPDLLIATDAVEAGSAAQLIILTGSENGMFANSAVIDLPGSRFAPTSVGLGDFNNDAAVDIAVPVGPGYIYYQGPNGFDQDPSALPFSMTTSVAAGDLNGDGNDDLAFGNENSISLAIQTASGMAEYGTLPATQPFVIALADLNGDGKDDPYSNFEYWLSTTSGYSNTALANMSPYRNSITLESVDGSIVGFETVGGNRFGSEVRTFVGNLEDPVHQLKTYDLPRGVSPLDVDRDGVRDLIVSHGWNAVGVFLGNSSGGYGPEHLYPIDVPNLFSTVLTIGDLNGDGAIDVVLPATHAGISILWGNPNP